VDNPDVYVNDSFEAVDAMAKAQNLTARGRWADAAQVLQRAIDRDERRLVRVASGSYTGMRRHIADLIAGWPAEGLLEYRRLFEPDLDSALKSVAGGRSIGPLLPLFEQYFCTAGGARLADTIGQLAIESGDPALAEYVYRRVLERHPDAAQHSEPYRAMLAVLAAIRGETVDLAAGGSAPTRIRWMGQDRSVRDTLDSIRSGFEGFHAPVLADQWPVFGGNPQRARMATCRVDDPGLLWRADLREDLDNEGEQREAGERKPSSGRELTVFPILADGLVLVQWQREVVALHHASGAVAWRFGSNKRRGAGFDYLDDAPPGWNAVTVQDGLVFATLPGDESPYHSFDSPRAVSELVCLEAQSGKVRWRVNQRSTDDPLAEISFDPSPLISHGSVYVVGRRRRAFGFEDCYLYRLRAIDGGIEYRTHLGSASTGSFGVRPATRTIPALDRGIVYLCTNLGTIAAVSAHSGEILWLRLYERIRPDSSEAMSRAARDVNPWEINPVMVAGDRIIALPTDSPNVLILSSSNGGLVRVVSRDALKEIETVLGANENLLCGVGSEAFCYDVDEGKLRWSSPLPGGGVLFGRGTWTDQELLVPRRNGLSRFRLADGSRSDFPWEAEGEGGNLAAFPDVLISAGAGRVAAYVRRADIWSALQQRMAAAPSDPLPAVELAEVALNMGEYGEALRILDQAVARADRATEAAEPALADRLFMNALKFASALAQRSTLEADSLDRLFAVASQFARSADANLRYRFVFAELYERVQQPDRAVRLYQQVLRDRTLRNLSWSAARPIPASRGGGHAESRIERILEQHGRQVYAPHEAEAKEWLASGKTAGDEELLHTLVLTFPNSEAAPQAMIACGELAARSGRAHVAARQFSRAYHRYPRMVDGPGLLRKIADTYEQAGLVEHAYRWLTKAAMEYPAALVEHEGRSWTLPQYRERLADAKRWVDPSRPKIKLPLNDQYERTFEGPTALLASSFADHPASQWSRFFVQNDGAIAGFDARSGQAIWPQPAPVAGNAELLIATDQAAVFATRHEVFALDAMTGVRRWSRGGPPGHLTDPGADWEGVSALRSHALQGNRLISARDDGTIECIAADSGTVLWSVAGRPAPAGRVRFLDPWVAYHAVQDNRAVVCLIDAQNGSWLDSLPVDESRPIEDLFVTLDGQVVVITSQAISSYDPDARARRWQTPISGVPRPGSLLLDLDALYFCGDEGELRKLDLDDGKNAWPPTERLVHRGETDLTVQREGVEIIVSATGSVSAFDSVNGLLLWRGTTPEKCRLAARAVTDSYVVAVDLADGLRPGRAAAYFYDHRNHSGLIPSDGAPDLGEITDVRAVLALDDALVIQAGQTIRGFAHP
jgi:outer membrane protein assembly factor BamB/thioredoxin-like negative regulator of GroEL